MLNEVHFRQWNIRQEFNKLNALLFNNGVKPVELKWWATKNRLGVCKWFESGRIVITMSSLFDFPQDQFLSVLAHEMIHAKLYQNGFLYEKHGGHFIEEMNRINGMNIENIHITVTGDTAPFGISTDRDKWILAVVGFRHGRPIIATFPQKYKESAKEWIIVLGNKREATVGGRLVVVPPQYEQLRLVWVRYADTYMIHQSRKGSIKTYFSKPDTFKKIIENSKLIATAESLLKGKVTTTSIAAEKIANSTNERVIENEVEEDEEENR